MARLVFLRRAEYDFKTYGGEIFFDINDRCVGKLAQTDAFVDVPAGTYKIKMYKLHYNTMIGFAEVFVTVNENDSAMLQYVMPTTVAAPGHIIISEYTPERANEIIYSINAQMQQRHLEEEVRSENVKKSNRTLLTWLIVGGVALTVLPFLFWICYMLFVQSLF